MSNVIELLKCQQELLESESKLTLMLGGIGVGKTFTLAHYVLQMVSKYPKAKGLIVANTITQLKNATMQGLTEELESLNIPFKLIMGGTAKKITIIDTEIYLYSLKSYENIRGIQVGWIAGDEVCFAKKESIDVILGRLRDKRGPLTVRFFSSPNSFNWAYDMFNGRDGDNKTDMYHLIKAKTEDNIFLPEGYYSSLLEFYGGVDSPMAKQELFGEFINLTAGAVYWAFDRNINVLPCKYNPKFPVYVGQDFNIGNMANCYAQYINGIFYIYQETILTGNSANTFDATAKIISDLGTNNVMVVPDSTGKARKTSSATSDHQIMRDGGLHVLETSNPLIRDRQNSVNIALKHLNLVIDPSCRQIIKELESLAQRDKEGDVSHVSVALGYIIYKLAPLIRKQIKSTQIQL